MSNNKKFKTLNGFWTSISPVKEGKRDYNYAEGHLQTTPEKEEKIMFFFQKPSVTNKIYENAVSAFENKKSTMVSSVIEDSEGKFLTCRTTEIKDKGVDFKRKDPCTEQELDLNTLTTDSTVSGEDIVNVSGQMVQIGEEISIKQFDRNAQQVVTKVYRTGVLVNDTGAVLIMLWENMSKNVEEADNVQVKALRRLTDVNGQQYLTTTFKSTLSKSNIECSSYDEEASERLLNIEIELFKEIVATIESVLVEVTAMCPRCRTNSQGQEHFTKCSNQTCGATFKNKTSCVRVDIAVLETGNN